MKIHKIGAAKLVDDICDAIKEKSSTTEELIILRAYRDTDGTKHLEWWTTAMSSRVWAIGALTYLAYKVQFDSKGWDDDSEPDL